MSNVHFQIGGRHYTVACADGEEAHIAELGALIDAKAASNPSLRNQGEPRMLLFTALMLADELHEARRELARLQNAAPAEPAQDAEPLEDTVPVAQVEQTIGHIARRLEAVAHFLENPHPGDPTP